MNENRKTVIIREIEYWKQNKMLPEHYCNYLLTLYTEGNRITEERSTKKYMFSSTLFLLFIPLIVFFLYFTELSFILQMAISLIFLLICLCGIIWYKKSEIPLDIPATVAALIFLLFSVHFTTIFFTKEIIYLYIILGINCLLWYICGRTYKLLYFTIASYIGFFLLLSLWVYSIME